MLPSSSSIFNLALLSLIDKLHHPASLHPDFGFGLLWMFFQVLQPPDCGFR
jgi:hypothetical protein